MNSIELMISEHENILKFNQIVRNACKTILDGSEICVEDFRDMISFARNYADKHHHGKEEQILFKEMVDRLGQVGKNLVTHGMLVEHDFGRLFISELETAVNRYESNSDSDAKLDIIANAIGYTKLLKRHIDKENEVVYTYAAKNLPEEVLNEVNLKTNDFERSSEESGIQKKYSEILKALERRYK